MSYHRANGLLLVALAFVLCALVAFLLYRQNFFGVFPVENFVQQPAATEVTSTKELVKVEEKKNLKVLKSFGSCGDESKNDIILSYSSDLVNALLDNINDVHCEAPKPGYPNYSFILLDPSLIRIAEMTTDYKNIFYLKVQNTQASSTYFLYQTDIATRQTTLVDQAVISSDWPLQKDFYENKLLPREIDGQLKYWWFTQDPKGKADIGEFLGQKDIFSVQE